jgi:hypothetical protein
MVVDVVTPLGPGVGHSLRDVDNLPAEAAPEARVAMATEPPLLQLLLDLLGIRHGVVLLKMLLKDFTSVTYFVFTYSALPCLQVEVLATLVSLPVIFAAEPFVTFLKGTAVGLFMSLHVFPLDRLALA